MVGSFIVLAITCILRVIAETLIPKYAWLEKCTPYINYAIYALVAVFALFVIIAIVRAILTVGRPKTKKSY